MILQAAVSDRDYALTLPDTLPMNQEANALVQKGKGDSILQQRFFDAPVTASRFLSLTERLGSDDMFSVDLSESELETVTSAVSVPIAVCFSAQDEFVPNKEGQKIFAEKLSKVLGQTSPVVACKYFTGDHALSLPQYYKKFIDYVCHFVSCLK